MKRRKPLTYIEKFELLKKIKAGVSKEIILQIYKISPSTYYNIISRKSEIIKNVNNFETLNRKTSKKSDEKFLNYAMIKWFLQERDRGGPLSITIIRQKALLFNKKLNGNTSKFKASNGWFCGFKKRYCIKSIQTNDGTISNNFEAEQFFSDILKEKITLENISLNNIYNADETCIFLRTSPFSRFIELNQNTKSSTSKKRNDDGNHIAALFCSNVNGSHPIPPLIIGETKTHGCLDADFFTVKSEDEHLKYIENLNIIYTEQNKSWMNENLFMSWYKDVFIPRVIEHQKSTGTKGKVILILDNAPCHPDVDELNSLHGNFEVLYLPRNASPLIQPMEQGLISMTKKLYKINLLKSLLVSHKRTNCDEFFSNLNFQECLILISKAWYKVNSSSFEKAWKSLLSDSLFNTENNITNNLNEIVYSSETSAEEFSSFLCEVYDQLSQFLPKDKEEYSKEFFMKWFETNYNNCGREPQTDEEIINFAIKNNTKVVNKEREFVEISCKEENENNCQSSDVKSSDAFQDIITFDDFLKMECVNNEIEENENNLENTELQRVTSLDVIDRNRLNEIFKSQEVTSSEAHLGLMTFRKWLETSGKSSKQHFLYIDELENLITQ
ncbi:jerky protein homolog-like [Leptopilina boulardi]|uniref:jerky protein homolog-like n=1 Tax=Leptopilina boulardi TaxID=63433 RepID=UPI0021F6635C|nr:jerky protein homolog-like [Leptopilina boulardi]